MINQWFTGSNKSASPTAAGAAHVVAMLQNLNQNQRFHLERNPSWRASAISVPREKQRPSQTKQNVVSSPCSQDLTFGSPSTAEAESLQPRRIGMTHPRAKVKEQHVGRSKNKMDNSRKQLRSAKESYEMGCIRHAYGDRGCVGWHINSTLADSSWLTKTSLSQVLQVLWHFVTSRLQSLINDRTCTDSLNFRQVIPVHGNEMEWTVQGCCN